MVSLRLIANWQHIFLFSYDKELRQKDWVFILGKDLKFNLERVLSSKANKMLNNTASSIVLAGLLYSVSVVSIRGVEPAVALEAQILTKNYPSAQLKSMVDRDSSQKILMVLTNHDRLGNTGRKTGFYLDEVAHPYAVFTRSGFEVDFVSPTGEKAPIDPKSYDRERSFKSSVCRR